MKTPTATPGHTAGPWTWMQRGDQYRLESADPSLDILRIANGGLLPMNADARLIASAPALLAENAALRERMEYIAHVIATEGATTTRVLAIARAALAQGKGTK